jgi:hypothetical protein
MRVEMFQGWENYYLSLGPSAAALIGLMFVVVTLTAGRDRSEVQRGKRLYTSPIVWHLGVVLVLSGAASAPTMTPRLFGILLGGLALIGIAICVRSAIGIARVPISGQENNQFDVWWYGLIPSIVYLGLGIASAMILVGNRWGASAAAASLMALLLISIHGGGDLVTFLAPSAEPPASSKRSRRND